MSIKHRTHRILKGAVKAIVLESFANKFYLLDAVYHIYVARKLVSA